MQDLKIVQVICNKEGTQFFVITILSLFYKEKIYPTIILRDIKGEDHIVRDEHKSNYYVFPNIISLAQIRDHKKY